MVARDGGLTYLFVSELSSHGRLYYVPGPAARRAFALVRDGFRIVGTLHADSGAEAIANLIDDVEYSPDDIACVDLLVITRAEGAMSRTGGERRGRVSPDDQSVRRRIVHVALFEPDPADRVQHVELAAWNAQSGRLELATAPAGVGALARWSGVATSSAEAEIAERADVLARLAAEGRRDRKHVDDAVRLFRLK